MKICRIVHAYSPYSFGGADFRTEKISKALSKDNKTIIITINPYRKYKDTVELIGTTTIYRFPPYNISSVHSIGKSSKIKQAIWTLLDLYSFHSYKKIKSILKKERPDVVHMHTPLDLTLSAVKAVKDMKLPLVYTLHEYFLLCRRMTLLNNNGIICTTNNINPLCHIYRNFTRTISKDIDIVIAPSQFILDLHIKNGFFKDCRHVILPHGIELNNMPQKERRPKKDGDKFVILYVGYLNVAKGVHILIDAFKQIKNDGIELHIIGGGILEEKLKNSAGDDRRIIFRGKIPFEDIQQHYARADLMVVPSIWYDVRPNVIIEAFREGLPVVGSNIGGIPELIQDNYNGFLFEPKNANQLKTIIENLMRDRALLEALGKNAIKFVSQFEMSSYLQKLTRVLEEAIEINNHSKLK